MRRISYEELILSGAALLAAGVSPNIFPAAQAGLAPMPALGLWLLLPSVILLCVVTGLAAWRGHRRLINRILAGAAAGFIATLGLEVVRATSFHVFEGMPGDLPRLLGVLLTDRFMYGPSLFSDIVGWTYHFWNGAAFGILFAVLLGRKSTWWALAYAVLIGIGFLLSPAVKSLGIGFMGLDMPSMPVTVLLAHLAYGLLLGLLCRRWIAEAGWLLGPPACVVPAEVKGTGAPAQSAAGSTSRSCHTG